MLTAKSDAKSVESIIKLKTEKCVVKVLMQDTQPIKYSNDLHLYGYEGLQLHQGSTNSEEFHPHNSTQCKQLQICDGSTTIDQITTNKNTMQ